MVVSQSAFAIHFVLLVFLCCVIGRYNFWRFADSCCGRSVLVVSAFSGLRVLCALRLLSRRRDRAWVAPSADLGVRLFFFVVGESLFVLVFMFA